MAAELKQLMDEVWVLGSLSHPSITRFCALCLDPPMIVMQYYPHGSLFDLLKRGRRADRRALHELTWAKRWALLLCCCWWRLLWLQWFLYQQGCQSARNVEHAPAGHCAGLPELIRSKATMHMPDVVVFGCGKL